MDLYPLLKVFGMDGLLLELKKGKSLPQNIDNLFFKEGAPKGIIRDKISELTGIIAGSSC